MEELFQSIAGYSALMLEFATVACVVIGALIAAVELVRHLLVRRDAMNTSIREIWMKFAAWILIALEFALGADIIRTAIAPTWEQIGQLGVIAVIRTFLGFFLDRDIEGFRRFGARGGDKPEV